MTIATERAEKAVEYLRDSAGKYGKARGYLAFCDANLRRVRALEMLNGGGDDESLGLREAKALASTPYHNAIIELQNATADYETLRAKREAAVMTIECWRSQASAAKQGLNL